MVTEPEVVGEPAEAPQAGPLMRPAVLVDGPAGGREVEVPVIAGCPPIYIGVCGGNYVRQPPLSARSQDETPTYVWWPSGASETAGDAERA